MARYIDAEKLEKDGWWALRSYQQDATTNVYETKKMTDFPTADVVEMKKGKWIYEGIRGRFPACRCSVCGSIENADWAVILDGANFCPHCGADMREETEDG